MLLPHVLVQLPHRHFPLAQLAVNQPERANLFMLLLLGESQHNGAIVLALCLEGSYDPFGEQAGTRFKANDLTTGTSFFLGEGSFIAGLTENNTAALSFKGLGGKVQTLNTLKVIFEGIDFFFLHKIL